MKAAIIAVLLLFGVNFAFGQPNGVPPGPPAVEIDGPVDVVVTNTPEQPIPVSVQNTNTEELFVHADTYSLIPGETADQSKMLFNVPSGKTLIIEYIDFSNSTVAAPNGQEAKLRIFYSAVATGGGFPGLTLFARSEGGNTEGGGQKVFLPVPSDTEVRGSVRRVDSSVQTTWRITIAGRLIPNP